MLCLGVAEDFLVENEEAPKKKFFVSRGIRKWVEKEEFQRVVTSCRRKRKYEDPIGEKYHNLKQSAKKRNLSVDFTKEELSAWAKTQNASKCTYCGCYLKWFGKKRDPNILSIDRVDNDKGYSLSNIVVCCNRCNTIKGNWFSYDEMIELGKTIARLIK